MGIEKYTFLQLALIIAALNWVAIVFNIKRIEYIAKPATMITLLAFVWHLRTGLVVHGYINWLLVAVFLSLISEIIQLLPRKPILPWMITATLASLAYILALIISYPPLNVAALFVIFMVGLTMYQIYLRLYAGLERSGHSSLRWPYLGFSIVISVMLISALLTLISNHWENYRALLVSAGALFYFISSIWFVWDRFVENLKFGGLRVTISFQLAQCLLCLGFLMTF